MNNEDLKSLEEFANKISKVAKNTRHLEAQNLMYKQQLVIVHLNNGKLRDMDYDDLNKIDWDQVNVNIGMTGFSVTVGAYDGVPKPMAKSWADMPLKK